jgi:hypothetical protein
MTPQLYKEVQDVLKETKATDKYLVRALKLISQLINVDIYVTKHVLSHLVSILK